MYYGFRFCFLQFLKNFLVYLFGFIQKKKVSTQKSWGATKSDFLNREKSSFCPQCIKYGFVLPQILGHCLGSLNFKKIIFCKYFSLLWITSKLNRFIPKKMFLFEFTGCDIPSLAFAIRNKNCRIISNKSIIWFGNSWNYD